jgi:hypothetical protein
MSESVELDVRRVRAAKNQSLFREVNERIDALSGAAPLASFICECMNESCDEMVALTREEYEQVRARSNSFLVIEGHDVPEVEKTIGSGDGYVVVAKLGTGEAIAQGLDPRNRVSR